MNALLDNRETESIPRVRHRQDWKSTPQTPSRQTPPRRTQRSDIDFTAYRRGTPPPNPPPPEVDLRKELDAITAREEKTLIVVTLIGATMAMIPVFAIVFFW